MAWKKSFAFFVFQNFKYARNAEERAKNAALYEKWKTSFEPGRNSLADEWPWLSFPAIEFLEKYLKPEHRVFEFGGGGSTLFFAKRVAFLATVENDGGWFSNLEKTMSSLGQKNWQGFFVGSEKHDGDRPLDISKPEDFASSAEGEFGNSFEKYAKTIHQFPEDHFDLVLVDGRSRPSCVAESLQHLKKGGILIIDNAEREHYSKAFKQVFKAQFKTVLDARAPLPYTPDFTKTMILRYL